MSIVPVIWLSYHDGVDARGPWDTGILERLFRNELWPTDYTFEHTVFHPPAMVYPEMMGAPRAIVVLPARHHCHPADIARLNKDLANLQSVLLILCGDEEGAFPWKDIQHPNIRFWVQMPDPKHYADMAHFGFFFGNGFADGRTPAASPAKSVSWAFMGQHTNSRRKAAVKGLTKLSRRLTGVLVETSGFAQGLDRDDYLSQLENAWVAPCPSGPKHVDTFRLYEALEAGCIPVVDGATPEGPMPYWEFAYGDVPFPVVHDWESVGGIVEHLYERRHHCSAMCSAWWQQQKRIIGQQLVRDLQALGFGPALERLPLTAIVTTSPTAAGASLGNIITTIVSVRETFGDIEIIVACDGVRPEQEHLRVGYEQFVYELCRWTESGVCGPIVPWYDGVWRHQAMTTFNAITQLGTEPVLLFMEHDAPLTTDEPIDFEGCVDLVARGHLDVIRFHHESHILPPHEHLMIDRHTIEMAGVPLRRTIQWSQRPHLAGAGYYLGVLGDNFTNASRCFIEDKMHSVVQVARPGRHRLAIYHPPGGNIKRSYHLDGRGDEPKLDDRQVF